MGVVAGDAPDPLGRPVDGWPVVTWRNCKASLTLADEVNERWPRRDKTSDGTIGDAAHASRTSDHNPWIKDPDGTGIVRARDIDEDLGWDSTGRGKGMAWLAEYLRSLAVAGDQRLRNGGYLIYEGRIASDKAGWVWRPYKGANPHDKHLHVSFSLNRSGYDSTAPWGLLEPIQPPAPKGPLMALTDEEQEELLTKVRDLHAFLAVKGKAGRQVLAELDQRSAETVQGVRSLLKKG